MTEFASIIVLIAQAPAPKTQPSGAAFLPIAMMVALVAFMLLSARSQKKREKREREEMYARLKKNDRILTVGGAIGTLISVKDDEVVLKVDESSNTKMTFMRSSVQRILSEESSAGGSK